MILLCTNTIYRALLNKVERQSFSFKIVNNIALTLLDSCQNKHCQTACYLFCLLARINGTTKITNTQYKQEQQFFASFNSLCVSHYYIIRLYLLITNYLEMWPGH